MSPQIPPQALHLVTFPAKGQSGPQIPCGLPPRARLVLTGRDHGHLCPLVPVTHPHPGPAGSSLTGTGRGALPRAPEAALFGLPKPEPRLSE